MVGIGISAATFIFSELLIDWPPTATRKRSRKPLYISTGAALVAFAVWWLA